MFVFVGVGPVRDMPVLFERGLYTPLTNNVFYNWLPLTTDEFERAGFLEPETVPLPMDRYFKD